MSLNEKRDLLAEIKELPDEDKAFIAGFVSGVKMRGSSEKDKQADEPKKPESK